MTYRSSILLLADGARYDIFEDLLEKGELPNIREHIIDRGAYSRMTSTFTSTTGPAYVPFMTGCFPGTVNMPGIRWFDKAAFGSKPFWNPHRFRSYCGWEIIFLNGDLRPDKLTLFEIFQNPLNIFNQVSRGARLQSGWIERINIAREKRRKNYEHLDDLAARLFFKRFKPDTDFAFVVFQGIDGVSHLTHPHHERVIEGYRRLDRFVGSLAADLKKSHRYDDTLIGICSDHGLTATHTHFDLAPYLEEKYGLKTISYTNIFRSKPVASVQVSGNAMAHVYFKNRSWMHPCFEEDVERLAPGLQAALLSYDAIDLLIVRRSGSEIGVYSRRGSAILSESDGGIHYKVEKNDPFGFGSLPQTMTHSESLERTWDTNYPDALLQILQLFRSGRTGDLIVVSNNGFDLREKWENPEHKSSHGSLHRDHIMVPFCLSHPFTAGPIRSADVFPTYLKLLAKTIPNLIDGIPFSGLD